MSTGLDLLEIGCGTGLLSFLIAPYAKHLTAVDTSHGMITTLKQKLASASHTGTTNIFPVCVDLKDPDDPALRQNPQDIVPKFDLVVSHLVLHHVPDLVGMLSTMHGCLKEGGSVCLTDYEDFGPEARKFHPESKMQGVERHGIKRTWMEEQMRGAGFEGVMVEVGWVMEKDIEGGEVGRFPFLVCQGRRGSGS